MKPTEPDSVQIYIFRHGETDWNRERRFQGHTDIALNENGRNQALELRKPIADLKPELILSSDLSRALETAKIVSEGLFIPIHLSEALREARLGAPEGQLRDDIIRIYGEDNWQKWLSVDPVHIDFCYPEGETKRQTRDRAMNFISQEIKTRPNLKTLAVSTHGGTLRRVVHHCEGAPAEPIPIPNCSLYHLELQRPTGSTEGKWIYRGALNILDSADKLFR